VGLNIDELLYEIEIVVLILLEKMEDGRDTGTCLCRGEK
jgi:hypothetical protein